jgi:hypothetical protein
MVSVLSQTKLSQIKPARSNHMQWELFVLPLNHVQGHFAAVSAVVSACLLIFIAHSDHEAAS